MSNLGYIVGWVNMHLRGCSLTPEQGKGFEDELVREVRQVTMPGPYDLTYHQKLEAFELVTESGCSLYMDAAKNKWIVYEYCGQGSEESYEGDTPKLAFEAREKQHAIWQTQKEERLKNYKPTPVRFIEPGEEQPSADCWAGGMG